ncbi:hypothetical protein HZA38_01260 [Candidatus Peregrinibacteria bacterium]|nr:hypothetical protein [Candidatus Peregrinibacteria bacterium]
MIKKFLNAEHLVQDTDATEIVKKKREAALKTEMWMLFSGPPREKSFAELIWKTLETAYFETLSGDDPYDRFEEALKIVNAQINAEKELESPDFLRSHSILIGLFVENALHITVAGNAEGYLVRKGQLSTITDGLAAKKSGGDVFINIASGELEDDDRIVFTLQRLLRYATSSQLSDILSQGVAEAEVSLEEMLHMSGDDTAFVVFHIEGSHEESLPLDGGEQEEKKKGKKFGVGERGMHIFERASSFLQPLWQRLREGDQKIFLSFMFGILGVIIIIFFLTSNTGNSDKAEYEKYKNLLAETRVTLKNVEDQEALGQTDRANANLNMVERNLKEILNSQFFRTEALAHLDTTSQIRDRINNITRISTPKELANLKTRKSDVEAKGIFEFDDEWYAYDQNSLFRIVLQGVENVIPLSLADTMVYGVPFEAKKKFIFTDTKGKFHEYDTDSNAVSAVKTEDETWKKSVEIQTYAKYLYLLSPADNQVWKYERKTEGYGKASPYFSEEYNISGAVSFSIDGFLYIFTSDGSLHKYLKGTEQKYEVKDAPEGALLGVTQIYTDADMENILMLSSENSTVYVFFKGENQATYSRQIVFTENVGKIQRMWAKAPKTLVVVDESKVYEIDF